MYFHISGSDWSSAVEPHRKQHEFLSCLVLASLFGGGEIEIVLSRSGTVATHKYGLLHASTQKGSGSRNLNPENLRRSFLLESSNLEAMASNLLVTIEIIEDIFATDLSSERWRQK